MKIEPMTIVVARNAEMFSRIGGASVTKDAIGIVDKFENGIVIVIFSPFITDKQRQSFQEKDVVPVISCDIKPEHITEAMLSSFFEAHLGQALMNIGQELDRLEKLAEPEIQKLFDCATGESMIKLLGVNAGINCHETLSPITVLAARILQLRALLQS